MSKEVTYDYLIKLREILCLDILDQFKTQGSLPSEDKELHKEMLYALLDCMVIED